MSEREHEFDDIENLNMESKKKFSESAVEEFIEFPDGKHISMQEKPVLLNSKEHAIGYLNKVLNARVYEAAIATELQLAKNLSVVSL